MKRSLTELPLLLILVTNTKIATVGVFFILRGDPFTYCWFSLLHTPYALNLNGMLLNGMLEKFKNQ